MRRAPLLSFRCVNRSCQNLIQIQNGTFYRQHPTLEQLDSSAALFRDLSFELPATIDAHREDLRRTYHWAVIGATGATQLLEVLRGFHVCIPPQARTFPYLSSEEIDKKDHRLRVPSRAIQYVGFNAGRGAGFNSGVRGAYLSARYESRREETDWLLLQYLKGQTDLNPSEEQEGKDGDDALLQRVIKDLRLEKLLGMPVSNLSNGQTRRARIARALLGKPELLLLDEPFMGLDPPTLVSLSPMLRNLAYSSSPLLLLALRPQDPIPDWITHLIIVVENNTIALMGSKAQVLFSLHRWVDLDSSERSESWARNMATQMTEAFGQPPREVGHVLTQMGVVPYSAYKLAKEEGQKYFGDHGEVQLRVLSGPNAARYSAAMRVPVKKRNLQDWLTLTSVVPHAFVDSEEQSAVAQSDRVDTSLIPRLERLSEQTRTIGDPLIELSSIIIRYGDKVVLGHPPLQPGFSEPGLNLTVRQGTRLALIGANGSGKTTLLSLLTSDHPHSYSLPIKFFGRTRLPQPGKPGLSLWEIQSRIGHSSPEIHGFFPRNLTVRKVLESAWADTFGAKPFLTYDRDQMVDAALRWWEPELRQFRRSSHGRNEQLTLEELEDGPDSLSYCKKQQAGYAQHPIWTAITQSYPPLLGSSSETEHFVAESLAPEDDSSLDWAEDTRNHCFGLLPFGTQRLLLLLRALIKQPAIIILDEAFSGLPPEVREKAMCWLEYGESVFLQRKLVFAPTDSSTVSSGDTPVTASSSEFPDESANTSPSSLPAPKPGPGRPSGSYTAPGLRRPPPVPGRAPGRPKGAKALPPGQSPWVPAVIRAAIEVDAKNRPTGNTQSRRWTTVKVPNLRWIVDGVCRKFDLRPNDLVEVTRLTYNERTAAAEKHDSLPITKPGRKLKGCPVWKMSLEELEAVAREELGREGLQASARPQAASLYRNPSLSLKQALIVVSHVREEVPEVIDEYLRLPGEEEVLESERGIEGGYVGRGWINTVDGWGQIWAL